MATINCQQFQAGLESWMEGERSSAAEAHWKQCIACRGAAEDLDAIRETAAAFRNDQSAPGPHVWLALQAQLEREGLVRRPEPQAARPIWLAAIFRPAPSEAAPGAPHPGWSLRPALAGFSVVAALAVLALVVAGPIQSRINDRSWVRRTARSVQPLNAELAQEEQGAMAFRTADPALGASLHSDLAVVDKYIVLCEKSVREEPENEMARDYLYSAYQQKAELLDAIAQQGENQ